NRLEEAGTAPLEDLFARVSAVVAARLEPYADTSLAPFAREVVALDHADLDPVARRLPPLQAFPKGDSRLLPGQFAGLFDLRRQQWRKVRFIADVNQNEKVTAREIIAALPEECLILCDLGFFGFAWFDDLTARKQFYVSRLRQKTSYTPIHTFYQDADLFDGIVWLGAYRADRAQHAVRLVRVRHRGRWHTYLTNVLDPTLLAVREVLTLYARRGDFELAIDLVKQHLGLHLLWSAKDVVIQQQLWAVLLISQILQALRLEVAGRAGVDPFEVSLELLARWFPRLVAEGKDPIATFVTYGRQGGFIRPSSRLKIDAPTIPKENLCPLPPDLVLERVPHHSQRKCGKRPEKRVRKQPNKQAN
ncbi:MAG TPA: transposase, partial [bacterium]|nr:transposase [bacterium]